MKTRTNKIISLLLAVLMLVSFCFTSCNQPTPDPTPDVCNHTFGEWQQTKAPTTSAEGEETRVCTTCGEPETRAVPKLEPDLWDDYFPEKKDGYNQVTFFWNGDLEGADMWIWWGDVDGRGYLFHECGYGGKIVVDIPEDVEQVGFIVRTGCTDPGGTSWGTADKDGTSDDRFATITGPSTVIYLKRGDGQQYYSNDGGKTLALIQKFVLAGMESFTKIRYYLTPAVKLTSKDQIKVRQGDRELEILSVSSLNYKLANGLIEVGERLDIGAVYTVEIEGFGEMDVVPTKVFDSKEFIENYTYDGDDLGSFIHGDTTTFKVWAPTASRVVLNLYQSGHEGEAYKNVDMVKGERGVWSHTEACGHGTYYTYTVTTSVGTQVATDPYGRAAGLNGNRTMVVDLSLTNPEGWGAEFDSGITSYGDAVIWEIHVRDFSNKIEDSQYKGKYLAFTERGLVNEAGVPVGVDYLVQLGITHVHLLPVYDYATVDEASPEDEFNWGYDPKNYNVPEGSYSTNPYDGWVRILEYKAMVQALHEAGIGVIMDVVYNHTYDGNSSFNRIVPYYYYRYTSTGANSSASGCGNDTASERYMFRKFMVDSVSYWMSEYDLDGFRFDLMGLHDLATMQAVESAVHTIDPKAIIYGEGWTMGATIDGSEQANQKNISKITPTNGAIGTIAVFNDAIRDGLKGSVFGATEQGFINGNHNDGALKEKVQFGINGGEGSLYTAGWLVKGSMVVNYMSAHDNLTLWDKLLVSCPDATPEELQRMNRLGAAILMISQGTPFWQAGEEFLRSKDGDENSYKSSDEINNIRWEDLTPDSDAYQMMLFYKGLIEMRKTYGVLREAGGKVEVTFQNLSSGAFAVLYTYAGSEDVAAVVVINPTASTVNMDLREGNWALVCDGTTAGAEAIRVESGTVSIAAGSLYVYVPAAE